ncbi:hypothetical protein MF265_05700 [Serratia marcescens]|uniref:hypothetical protein n=1 Tax=Serratia marcescens TaxID=615 RepID=UPI001EF15E21|nr:hypothetical protein [Serratia marcescens]ULH12272.1 hypothetical protein MF265_05700 [Serratia marcescens]
MSKDFDFQLKADDEVSATLKNLEDAVKKMLPDLDKAQNKLQLGGQKTIDDLGKVNSQFANMGKLARQNVQFVGDIVPPLKIIGGLSLGLGGAAVAVNAIKTNLTEFANTGFKIDTTAKNIDMTTQAFQQLTGAMIENGSARADAENSITSLFDRANDALKGRNENFKGIMLEQGIDINETKNGVADVSKLIDDIQAKLRIMPPVLQAIFVQKSGLSPDLLNYLRNSTEETQRLKDQAQRDGLIFSDQDIQNALAFNQQINGITAAMEGLTLQTQAWLGQSDLMKNSVEEINQIVHHGLDRVTVGKILGFNSGGDQGDLLRKAEDDDAFKKTLSLKERSDLYLGYASSDLINKLNAYYGPMMKAQQLQNDTQQINVPTVPGPQPIPLPQHVDPNSRQVRNNNFWDLNYAKQHGATLEMGVPEPRFAHFKTPEQGVKAADRQLMMYYTGTSDAAHHRRLMTLRDIINVASPKADHNKTDHMIAGASRELGVSPDTPLNLYDPALRSRVLNALFNQEGNNPFTAPQVQQIIQQAPSVTLPPLVQPAQPLPPPVLAQDKGGAAPPSLQKPGDGSLQANRPSILQETGKGDHAELVSALKEAMQGSDKKIEITIVDGKTGERRIVSAPPGGKVTTSMSN